MDEFPHARLLQMEKEVTGIYISGHPLDDYMDELSQIEVTSQFLESLKEEDDGGMAYDHVNATMAGIIQSVRAKATKNGSMMGFVQLEDLYGITEVLVFPKIYERIVAKLEKDAAVAIVGQLSVREEEDIKLLAENVYTLKDYTAGRAEMAKPIARTSARVTSGKLYLKLTSGKRERAIAILRATPGNIPVVFRIEDENKTFAAPRDLWVNHGYAHEELVRLLGEKNVVMKSEGFQRATGKPFGRS
jgi:DNA polymerase-3 subunit alpha